MQHKYSPPILAERYPVAFIAVLIAFITLRQARKRGRNLKGVIVIDMPDADHGANARVPELAEHGYKISARVAMATTG